MTDKPFSELQDALRKSQPPRATLFCSEGIETVEEVKPTPVWKIVGGFVLAAALIVCVISVARAAEPRLWMIWDVAKDRPFHPHKFVSPTACMTDIGHVKDDGGKRLACVRINPTKGE
jgi:hypothetical protein